MVTAQESGDRKQNSYGGIFILRVIAGTAKGHKLKTVKGMLTRPTSDRVKESLFNIIAGYIQDADIIDLFAGTGSLGIEALSRGARSATFVDKRAECISVINDNLVRTGLADRATVLNGEVKAIIEKLANRDKKYDIILMDPPYNKNFVEDTLKFLENNDIIKDDGILIAERDIDDDIPGGIGKLKLFRDQKYGGTVLSFYKFATV